MKVNNALLLVAVKESQEKGVATQYLTESIGIIATRYSTFKQWGKPEHSDYRDEMVTTAIIDMNKAWDKIIVDRLANPFTYLATATCHAFFKTARKYDPDFTYETGANL